MRGVTKETAAAFNGILNDEDDEQRPDPLKEKPVEQKTVPILPAIRPEKNPKKKKK